MRDLSESGRLDLLAPDFPALLKEQVDLRIERQPENYRDGGRFTPPSRFISGRTDFTYPGNEEICHFYVRYLEGSATDRGYWEDVAEVLPGECARRDQRGSLIVDNMLFIERIVKRAGFAQPGRRGAWAANLRTADDFYGMLS